MSLAQGTSFILQFSSTVVLARYLGPYELGISAMAFAVAGILAIVQQLGLPAFIIREEALTDDLTAAAFSVNAVLTVLLSGGIAAASLLGAAFVRNDAVGHALLVLAVSPLFSIVSLIPAARLERDNRFKEIAIVGVLSGIAGSAITIVGAIVGASYMSVVYGQIVSAAVLAVLLVLCGRQYQCYTISFRAWRRIAVFSMQIMAVSGITTLSFKLSEIVLARILGLTGLGLFTRASGINGLLWNNIHAVVGRVVLVDFAGLYRTGQSLRERYLRTVAITTAILWPGFAGLAAVAKPFVVLVYGPQWISAVPPFMLLALASMVLVSITMTWELFTATGNLATQTRIEGIRAAVSFVLFVIGCSISLNAAAASRIVEAVIAFVIFRPHINRMTDTVTADYWPIYGRSALLTLVAVSPATILMMLAGPASPTLPLLLVAIAGGIALWAGTLLLLRHPIAQEAVTMLQGRGLLTHLPSWSVSDTKPV